MDMGQPVQPVDSELDQALGSLVPIVRAALGNLPADIVGLAGADWIHHVRIRSWHKLTQRTNEIIKSRGTSENIGEVNPRIAYQVLEATQIETSDELLELWARLLAAASDPTRIQQTRRSFIDLLKQFDPIDAVVFQYMWSPHTTENLRDQTATELGIPIDVVVVSFLRLKKLELVANPEGGTTVGNNPTLTALGRELSRALRD
jgi:hypothetical protein